jgi:hypothetical protein
MDYESLDGQKLNSKQKRRLIIVGVIVLIVVLIIIITLIVVWHQTSQNNNNIIPTLSSLITIENLLKHLQVFENIAQSYNNSRAIQFGYNASAEYVKKILQNSTNFKVWEQFFPVEIFTIQQPAIFRQIYPENITYLLNTDFLDFGSRNGIANITGIVKQVLNFGCNSSDFVGFNPNEKFIALIERGNCTFRQKVLNSQNVGAIGALIYNNVPGLFMGSMQGLIEIPAFAITLEIGQSLKETTNITINMYENCIAYNTTTLNVFAETPSGDENNIIVVGSHLDSVPAGPGINDNGSGSSTNIELALQLFSSNINYVNKIRFAWWGAEEIGLKGSTYYVSHLNQTQLKQIALNINLDMVGSPNYFLGIYNGSQAAENIRNASEYIQELFEIALVDRELNFELTSFDGRSDYAPFIQNGIPAGMMIFF